MLKLTKIAFLVSTLLAGAAFANTATTLVVNEPIAREAGERRGEGAGHPAIEVKDQLARRGEAETRGEGAGHPAIEVKDQLARNGADDGQPDDRGGADDDTDEVPGNGGGARLQLARNGADDGQPNDRGGRRGGRGGRA